MQALERIIDYHFKKPELLKEALTHSSFGYENDEPFNERLEFLGDAILGYLVSRELYLAFPKRAEGTLSKLKSVLVSASTLTDKAQALKLNEFIRLGRGETRAGGRRKPSILADAMEALIGAVCLDGGLSEAELLVKMIYGQDIQSATLEIKNAVDFKTVLQERLQELALGLPTYSVAREEGPAHDRRFVVRVRVGNYQGPSGRGTSKKNAQQECARRLLEDSRFWNDHAPARAENI